MCEPNHSIVQYPDKDDDNNPTGPRIDALAPPVGTDGGYWTKLKKKVDSWFHFSYLGLGHSETIGRISTTARWMLPLDTKYEAQWWDRKVKLDGCYNGHEFDKAEALESATVYASKISIGNLHTLRQFLETSMKKSEAPWRYIYNFPMMLTPAGRDLLQDKLRSALHNKTNWITSFQCQDNLDTIIKVMLGFTRKRNLLVPEWSDDGKLWGGV